MDIRQMQKIVLYVFIGFLAVAALVAIVAVFLGEFTTVSIRIMFTSLTISALSICAMAAGAFIVRRGIRTPGVIALGVSLVAAGLVITGIWAEIDAFVFWKITIVGVVWTVGFSHLLLLWLPRIRQVWAQIAVTIADVVLAVLISVAVVLELSADGFIRAITVVSILALLLTSWVPLFMWLSSSRDSGGRLVLRRLSGDQYRSGEGRVYRVHEILGEDADSMNDDSDNTNA